MLSAARTPERLGQSAGSCRGAVALHHQARSATRNVSHDGGAPMQLGNGAEVDGKGEYDLLALTQPEIRGLDEDTRGTEVHRFAELSAAARNGDIDNGSSTVPRMQAAFHFMSLAFLILLRRDGDHYAALRSAPHTS